MADSTKVPPRRRGDLVFGSPGDNGQRVIKDPAVGAYYNLGPEEAFLLAQLDGLQSVAQICASFESQFGQPLSVDELREFVLLAATQGFLELPQPVSADSSQPEAAPANVPATLSSAAGPPELPTPPAPPRRLWRNLLYWRTKFFDPDGFFNWLEPKIRFFWTRTFVLFALLAMLGALCVTVANWRAAIADFPTAIRWEIIFVGWLTLLAITFCHEFAHGLTCKHYGGEVHEVGFLLLFLMPCFYCNVSDAWLFREKAKRLWVTLAGGFWDLFLWAVAVFVWRLTLPGTTVHFVALSVMTVCGARSFFNFNPFFKLDGYYLLSDWMEIPNLHQRSLDLFMAHLRRLLWGAPRPEPEARGRFLVTYGVLSWLISLTYLGLLVAGLLLFVWPYLGWVGTVAISLFGFLLIRGLFHGFTGGEVIKMIQTRFVRTAVWVLVLAAVPTTLWLIRMEDRASGNFQLRAPVRAELRAPVSGFLREIAFAEGEQVTPSVQVALIEIPDLASRLAQKDAEIQETKAKLRQLETGARYEELEEQKQRVARASSWRDLAEADLAASRKALQEELAHHDRKLAELAAELEFVRSTAVRDAKLVRDDVLPRDQLEEKRKNQRVIEAQTEQVRAQQRARQAIGTRQAEMELAKREKELADARGALKLLEAGHRPEEIEAERAHLTRLKAELNYLEALRGKVQVYSPVAGIVTTPHLKDRVGQFVKEGDLICTIEAPNQLEAEIVVSEQDVASVRAGQKVELKARALPYRSFQAVVTGIAPVARGEGNTEPGKGGGPTRTEIPNSVTITCVVEDANGELRPGMTGYARIYSVSRPVLEVWLDRGLRYLRTEFWW
jgi:multidrug efflux pump subunit AcrA (membrane-fusion protein)